MSTPHNPDALTPEQIDTASGWRLLDADEIHYNGRATQSCDAWVRGIWDEGWAGMMFKYTYRTRLSRAELRVARGLPPEFRVNIAEINAPVSTATPDTATDTILGIPVREYLAQQFPDTVGNIPMMAWLNDVLAAAKDRNDLARWKKEMLTVESWWSEIDTFIRKHPDGVLGDQVSTTALQFLRERDELRATVQQLQATLEQRAEAETQLMAEARQDGKDEVMKWPHVKEPFQWMERWLNAYNTHLLKTSQAVFDVRPIMAWINTQPMGKA